MILAHHFVALIGVGWAVVLMVWHAVEPGDFFYIPAGTVHAIGVGVSLIEVQQNSDITYRLYDYGRPRELHLEAGMRVAQGTRYPMALHKQVADGASAITGLIVEAEGIAL